MERGRNDKFLERKATKEYKDEDFELRYSRNEKIRAFDRLFDSTSAKKFQWLTIEEVKPQLSARKPSPKKASSIASNSPRKHFSEMESSRKTLRGANLPLNEDGELIENAKGEEESNRKEVQRTDMQRLVDDLKDPEKIAVLPKEVNDFGRTLELSSNHINRIVYLDNEGDTFKRDARVEKFKNLGFTVDLHTSPEKLKVVLSYALVITTPTYIDNLMRVTDIEKNNNVIGILILVENDFLRNYVHLTKRKKVVDVYSNFEEAFNYIIMAARFYQKIEYEAQIPLTLGINFDTYFKKVCCADENISDILELGVLPFKSFVKNNMADIAGPDWIESQLNDFVSRLTVKDKFSIRDVVEFLCKYESFILVVINAILKNQNLKFFRYISPFMVDYQEFMSLDQAQAQRAKYESIEVYRKLSINPNLINNFIKTFEKEKYFFFPGIISATRDRKRVSNLVGNVLLSIRIEPDYLYKSKTLFRPISHAKAPKLVQGRYDTAFKQEYMFPLFYPFKITGVKQINEVLEVSITAPNVFYYTNEDISLINDKVELDQVLTEQVAEVCSTFNLTNPFRKNTIAKKRNPDFAYEIESCDLFLLNYEYFQSNNCNLAHFLDNNHIIKKARDYQNKIQIENNRIREVENLLVLIHSLKNSKSQHSFRIMYMNIEYIETEEELQKATRSFLSYRLILTSPGRSALSCNNFVNDIDLSTSLPLYELFFQQLVTIVEVHLSFTAVEVKHKELMNQGTQFFRLSKLIPRPEILSLNFSCNHFGLSIFKDFMEQNPMLQWVSSLSLRLDSCNLHDDEMNTLNLLTKVFKLETLEISLEKNHLTDASINNLLFLMRFKQLKDVKVFLGGNRFSPESIKRLNEEFKLIKCKIYDKL